MSRILARYTSGNTLYGEGQGVLTTQQGEMVTYTQQAIGQITPEGRVVFQGSIYLSNHCLQKDS
jgi:hypothetical protein